MNMSYRSTNVCNISTENPPTKIKTKKARQACSDRYHDLFTKTYHYSPPNSLLTFLAQQSSTFCGKRLWGCTSVKAGPLRCNLRTTQKSANPLV